MSSPRPTPPSARGLLLGVAGTLLAAAITAAVRTYDHSKVDVSRFEKDSIANLYERQADRVLLRRIDSSTQLILHSRR
jgi:hypothetical protein